MTKLIVANWKMNGSREKVIADINEYLMDSTSNAENVVLALPYVYLSLAQNELAKYPNARLKLASQDVSKFLCNGAYTGEISAEMLKDLGVSYTIVGHSERRIFFNETNHTMAKKIDMALMNNLIPIFCFGEEKAVREKGNYMEVLAEQLQLLHLIEVPIQQMVIAYEPVWAIGTGLVPTASEIAEVMQFLDGFVQNYLPHAKITTLYGGSVNSSNIESILAIDKTGGVLVGGASLKVGEFKKICSCA